MSIDGLERLHNLHINPFRLMIVHATQNLSTSSNLDMRPLAKDAAISIITGRTSFTSSILRTLPRTCRVYLLTAVWVIPNRLATSFCFNPYVCINCFAIAHRMAGTTDFTATSQGINMVGFTKQIIVKEKYLSMTYVIYNMTYVIKSEWGMPLTVFFSRLSLSAGPAIISNSFMTYATRWLSHGVWS